MKLLLLLLIFISCKKEEERNTYPPTRVSHQHMCDGDFIRNRAYRVYKSEEIYDEVGVVKRYVYYRSKNSETCVKQQMKLTNFEERIRKRHRQGIRCEPQTELGSEVFLRAANNYYEYRNGRHFIHLDPQTGIYRTITFGEDKVDGRPVHAKKIGCFWMRQDNEDELWGTVDYGLQLYMDEGAGSETSLMKPIYKVTISGNDWQLTGNDQISDWNHNFCPYSSVPWGYCDLSRNGNIMFYADLNTTQQSQLLAEALLIRTQNNYIEVSSNEFEDKWEEAMSLDGEIAYWNMMYNFKRLPQFKHKVIFRPDGPSFTEQAWIAYIKKERPMMPDVRPIRQRPICYDGYKEVTLASGATSFIEGEICYVDGVYEFTQF